MEGRLLTGHALPPSAAKERAFPLIYSFRNRQDIRACNEGGDLLRRKIQVGELMLYFRSQLYCLLTCILCSLSYCSILCRTPSPKGEGVNFPVKLFLKLR